APDPLVTKRLGVEAGGHLAALPEAYADSLRYDDPGAAEDAADQRAEVGLVPAVVGPVLFMLVAPVAQLAAVEPGELRQQQRHRPRLAEVARLLRVEVVARVAVHRRPPVRPRLRLKRGPVEVEPGGRVVVNERGEAVALPQFQEEAQQVV